MHRTDSRDSNGGVASVAEGWSIERLTPPSRLHGANGLRTGPDGRLYVAQVTGSQISAIDIATGAIEVVSPMGGAIVGPDDLAFDSSGNMYVTEFTEGRISVRSPSGATRVLRNDIPGANPITVHRGRVFAGECRPGARLMELDLDGGEPRILAADIPMANAMEVGPDGRLYFPVMGTNEIWRIDLAGGNPEVVAGDLGVPDAVKFDASGFIVSTQVATGQVLRIDPRTGSREILATLEPGLDNLAFVGERLFVSRITGQIEEIQRGGGTRPLIPGGFNWPLGLAIDPSGALVVSDGAFFYRLAEGLPPQTLGMLFSPGFPGYFRGIARSGTDEYVVTTAMGGVARYSPERQWSEVLVEGLDRPSGVDVGDGGAILVAETGAGRLLSVMPGGHDILASGLADPVGVLVTGDGDCLVTEAGAGRVIRVAGGRTEILLDGLDRPHGIAGHGGRVYVLDVGAQSLIEYDVATRDHRIIAANLPVGAPAGIVPKPLRAIPPISGPLGPFADIICRADGSIYLSADREGSVLLIRPS